MKRFKNILVATDTRIGSHPVLDAAAEIAGHNQATLTVVDVIPDFSWSARLSMEDPEHLRELIRQEKAEKLEALVRPVRDNGINVETKLLEGKTSVEIIREVLRGEHDLVMSIAKGTNSKHTGFFGHTARRLLRNCPSAIWLIAPDASPTFKHALACVDTSTGSPLDAELNDKVFELASSIVNYHHARLSVVHAWQMPDVLLSAELKPKAVAEYERSDREGREKAFDKFLQQHGSGGSADNVHLVRGGASDVIPAFASEHAVDLVVMGTVARSGLSGVLMGNTSEKILDRLECSVLAVKPYSFKSPIRR